MARVARWGLLFLVFSLVWPSVVIPATVELAWDPVVETPTASVQGYKLYRGNIPCTNLGPLALLTDVGKVTTYIDPSVPSTWVDACYEISAYNTKGDSGRSNRAGKVLTVASTVPGTPVLTVTTGLTSLDVTYAPVPDGAGGTAKVGVRIGSPTDHWGLMVEQPCTTSPCKIIGLTPGTMYRVQAVAYRTDGTVNVFGPLSVPVDKATLTETVPPAPTGLRIVSSSAQEIIVVASISDCSRVVTSTRGSTSTQLKRTMTCVR